MNTMKKFLFSLALLVACQLSYGQTVKELIQEFSKAQGAECINIGGVGAKFMKVVSKDMKGIKSVQVIDLSSCSGKVITKFDESIRNLKDTNYEVMVKSNEEGERTRVLIGVQGGVSEDELVVLTSGSDPTIVKIKGKITKKVMAEINK